jgi:hypothetical protein
VRVSMRALSRNRPGTVIPGDPDGSESGRRSGAGPDEDEVGGEEDAVREGAGDEGGADDGCSVSVAVTVERRI